MTIHFTPCKVDFSFQFPFKSVHRINRIKILVQLEIELINSVSWNVSRHHPASTLQKSWKTAATFLDISM